MDYKQYRGLIEREYKKSTRKIMFELCVEQRLNATEGARKLNVAREVFVYWRSFYRLSPKNLLFEQAVQSLDEMELFRRPDSPSPIKGQEEGMGEFTEQAIKVIRSIPPGKVMTYGQIAKEAGTPRGARQVAWILHSMSAKYELPWHRVINEKGQIALAGEEGRTSQQQLLEEEGISVTEGGKINLQLYRHDPGL